MSARVSVRARGVLSSPALAIGLECVGVALLVWGLKASSSLSSKPSELFQGAPSHKAIAFVVIGAVVAGFGLVRHLRRTV